MQFPAKRGGSGARQLRFASTGFAAHQKGALGGKGGANRVDLGLFPQVPRRGLAVVAVEAAGDAVG